MSSEPDDRQQKLGRFFTAALSGKVVIDSVRFGSLSIDAVCMQDDVASLGDQLLCQPRGLEALQCSIRQDLSLDFIHGPATQLLAKLSEPSLADIDAGRVLARLIKALIQPSFFWSACISYLKQHALNSETTVRVAWLLSEKLRLFTTDDVEEYVQQAKEPDVINILLSSESLDVRTYGYKIKKQASLRSEDSTTPADAAGPGGRHDNDFRSIKDIQLMPTRDEILSIQPLFLRTAAEVFASLDADERDRIYPDHMFRLLREDMLHDFKEKFQNVYGGRSNRRSILIPSTTVSNVYCEDLDGVKPWLRQPWALCFKSSGALPGLEKMTNKKRAEFLNNARGPGARILRHGALVAICAGRELVGTGLVNRLVDRLSSVPAEVVLCLHDGSAPVLNLAASGTRFDLLQIDTAVFAYEPFLKKLQSMSTLPLSSLLLGRGENQQIAPSNERTQRLLTAIEARGGGDLQALLGTSKPLRLDQSQRSALLSGLKHAVSLIQGPPGTGKSFIGSLIARALYDHVGGTMLVICYTNHALDQFTEDLMDTGIPSQSIVRLGSKSTKRTEPLLLRRQQQNKLSRHDWVAINQAGTQMKQLHNRMINLYGRVSAPISAKDILSYLEFSHDDRFYDAFNVPTDNGDMKMVGRRGKAVDETYLVLRWLRGEANAGPFAKYASHAMNEVWQMSHDARRDTYTSWCNSIRQQHVDDIKAVGSSYNHHRQATIDRFRMLDADTVASKRIIACTSTYAAMSSDILGRVRPEIVLLEEAGELLEPHVLTSMSACTERLVMIGDHQQLRPKIANYSLSVESGNGYDLNDSLFERLVLAGFPNVSLSKQHRMRSEIAGLVRHLTYPNLEDAESVANRPLICGLQQPVIFIDHREPESLPQSTLEQHAAVSKQNSHEAALTLCYVKYVAQQGYGADDMVVLTPYLGQLRLLQEKLGEENDPVLNDLDSHDLYQAGLLNPSPSVGKGRQIHLCSIDNFQGEERNIVIVSLTRSNPTGDIGFMPQPERLNVLLSRARDGLIIIGNMSTFTSSKKGGELWGTLKSYVKEHGMLYQGLPIECQSHPDVKNIAVKPDDFKTICPDGGCSKPW